MKKQKQFVIHSILAAGILSGLCAMLMPGCSTITTTATPAGTNIVTVGKSLDPAAIAQIDQIISNINAEAPAAIADAQAISALVHGTNK